MVARSFAHLVGLGRRSQAAATAEETDDQRDERERREDEAHAERDEEMRRRADDGEDTDESEDERRERDARDARRARRAAAGARQAAEDDDDDEGDDTSDREEMRGYGVIARARARERGRIAAILASPRAAANLPMALELACNSPMSRDQALGVLARTPLPQRIERAARNPQLGAAFGPGSGSPAGGSDRIQDMWSQAFARVVPAMRNGRDRR